MRNSCRAGGSNAAGVTGTHHRRSRTAQWQTRIDLAAAHRLAVQHGFHEGIFNVVQTTTRVPGHNDRYYQIPFGLHWSEVTASCLMEVRL